MRILGIETSCDETSCAVVENGRMILSNIIASQIKLHRKTGGVVPEVAAREHVTKIVPVLEMALKKAQVRLADINAIAVTAGPGLLSSLLIGVNAAQALAVFFKKPLIPVNHIEGHIYANWLVNKCHKVDCFACARNDRTIQFPAAVLTVSGGHNELILWKGHGRYEFLGATLDDAAGEAFDKVARLLGLPYPGGPAIQKAARRGDPNKYPLPRAWLPDSPWDFSFSGLKTAVLYLLKRLRPEKKCHPELVSGSTEIPKQVRNDNDPLTADIAASFQEAVCEVLATKLVNAAKKYRVAEIHLAGGVSANQRLRKLTAQLIQKNWRGENGESGEHKGGTQPRLRFCKNLTLCTDNAAMIAAAGYFKYKKHPDQFKKWRPIGADPNLEIKNW